VLSVENPEWDNYFASCSLAERTFGTDSWRDHQRMATVSLERIARPITEVRASNQVIVEEYLRKRPLSSVPAISMSTGLDCNDVRTELRNAKDLFIIIRLSDGAYYE